MPIALKVAAAAGLVWIGATVAMIAYHLRERVGSKRTKTPDTSD
jgi:hypothetical protein